MNEEHNSNGSMPDLSGLVSGLLSNPGAVAALSSLLGNLSKNTGAPSVHQDDGAEEQEDAVPASTRERETVERPRPLPEPTPRPRHTDNRSRLLDALRPYLTRERRDMIDSILRILELLEILQKRR